MKKRLLCALTVTLVTMLMTTASAAGLPDSEYKRMLKASPEFAAAEKHLNAAWTTLGQTANTKQMEEYKVWQKNWLGDTRQESVAAMLAMKGGKALIPDEALKDGKVNKDLAYAVVTEERARWLDELTKQEKDATYLPEFAGRLAWGRNPVGGYLAFTPDGWWTEFLLCYSIAVEEIPGGAGAKEALDNSSQGKISASVKGRLTSELGFEWYGDTPDIADFSVTVGGKSSSDQANGDKNTPEDGAGRLMLVNITGDDVKIRSVPDAKGNVLFQGSKDKDYFVVVSKPTKDDSGREWYEIVFIYVELGEDDASGDEDTFTPLDTPAYVEGNLVEKNPDSDEIVKARSLEYYYSEKLKQ